MVNPKIKIVLSILVLLILVYIVDSLFFRHLFWERLVANILIVLAFAIFYLKYLREAPV